MEAIEQHFEVECFAIRNICSYALKSADKPNSGTSI